jgi:hypothetical protein
MKDPGVSVAAVEVDEEWARGIRPGPKNNQ